MNKSQMLCTGCKYRTRPPGSRGKSARNVMYSDCLTSIQLPRPRNIPVNLNSPSLLVRVQRDVTIILSNAPPEPELEIIHTT